MNEWISREAVQAQRPVFESVRMSMLWCIQAPQDDKFIFKYLPYTPTRLEKY